MGLSGPSGVAPTPNKIEIIGGLLRTIEPSPNSDVDGKWELGLSFNASTEAVSGDNLVPCEANTSTAPELLGDVDYQPWEIRAGFRCEAHTDKDTVLKLALEAIEKVASRNLEQELWHGTISQAESWTNNWLTNSSSYTDITPAGGPQSAGESLAALQYGILRGSNSGGVIHASVRLVSLWYTSSLIEVKDGKFVDVFGNFIVCGAGYDGIGEDGSTEWAYATGPMVTRISEAEIFAEEQSTVDRQTNVVQAFATVFVAAYWDNVVHLAVQADSSGTASIVVDGTILNGETTSSVIDIGDSLLGAIGKSASIEGASITFLGAATLTGTYRPIVDQDGNTVALSCTTATSEIVSIDDAAVFMGIRFLKIVFGTPQTGDGALELYTFPV